MTKYRRRFRDLYLSIHIDGTADHYTATAYEGTSPDPSVTLRGKPSEKAALDEMMAILEGLFGPVEALHF